MCRLGSGFVMPGLVPGIHVLAAFAASKDVDGRDKPGHDAVVRVELIML